MTGQTGATITGVTTISGGAVSLNNDSNNPTNVNTGTSNGAVNIGNGTTGGNVISIGNTVGLTGINEKVGTGNYSLDGVAGSTYTVGASTVGGTISIGGTAQTGAITLGSSSVAQTVNVGTGTGANAVNIATGGSGNVIIGKAAGGNITMPNLTASRPVKTDGSSNLIATTINLASSNDVGASILGSVNGGTGYNSYTDGQLLIGNTTGNTLTKATLTGTANQISVANGSGSIQLSTPQNIHTTATPTFDGLTLSLLTANSEVFTNGSSALTTTAPGSGNLGHWNRSGTTLSPKIGGDAVTTSGNIYTTVNGTITSAGLLTGSLGATISGAAVNLNAGSDFATNINTGTSNGAVNIANGTVGSNAISIGNTLGTTGLNQLVGTGNYSLNGVGASTYTIGSSTTTGTISIGGSAQTGSITLGSSTAVQTVNIGTGTGGRVILGNATGTVNVPRLTASLPVRTDGTSNLVSGSIGLATMDVSGILPTVNGGTGLSSITTNNLIYGNGAGAVNLLAPGATTGALL